MRSTVSRCSLSGFFEEDVPRKAFAGVRVSDADGSRLENYFSNTARGRCASTGSMLWVSRVSSRSPNTYK